MAQDIDIGHGVTIRFFVTSDAYAAPAAGLVETHRTPSGEPCSGTVLFDRPGAREALPGHHVWTVEQEEPLTLAPSVLCRRCGHHGFIREGRWVPA